MGFAVEAVVQPAWITRSIEVVQSLPWTDVAVVLVTGRRRLDSPASAPVRSLYDTFAARELRRLPTPFGDPFHPLDLSACAPLKGTPIRHLATHPGDQRTSDSVTLDEVAKLDLDVLICASPGEMPQELLSMPRHGTWGFEGATDRRRASVQAFWDVMNRIPLANVGLYSFNPDGTISGTIISAPCRTILGSPLVTDIRNRWKWPSLLVQALAHLRLHGRPPTSDVVPQPPPDLPANGRMAYLWSRHTMRLSRLRAVSEVVRPQWSMHYCLEEAERGVDHQPRLDFHNFKQLAAPHDRIWADPFPVKRDGRYLVFFEEKLDSEPFGHISVVEIGPGGPLAPPRTVLSLPHHLSYPYIFEWEGATYMMPESHDLGRLEVYRASKFPDEWEFVTVALHEPLADASIAEIDGAWWMFAARQSAPHLDCDELVIYHARTPLGPWTPHEANPVFSDVRRARPAGRPFRTAQGWIRPAQDGARGYGHSMRLMRITRLTCTDYEEELIQVLPPDWSRKVWGNHTLNAASGVTTIDAVRYVRRHRGMHSAISPFAPLFLNPPGA